MADPATGRTESGIDALIARLRDQGVAAGRSEADRVLAEAKATARATLEAAEAEAKAKLDAARHEIDGHRRAGEEALKVAARDTVLALKETLSRRFADEVGKTVAGALRDDEMLERMILEVVGRAAARGRVDEAGAVEVLLPRSAVGLDELRRSPEELREGTLSHFAAASAAEMLREGVRFGRAEDGAEGIRVVLAERGVTLDLTDAAVAAALLEHLQPRFRALLEGVVK